MTHGASSSPSSERSELLQNKSERQQNNEKDIKFHRSHHGIVFMILAMLFSMTFLALFKTNARIGKTSLLSKTRSFLLGEEEGGGGGVVVDIDDELPRCEMIDANLRTKLLHAGTQVLDSSIGESECLFLEVLGEKARSIASKPSDCVSENTVLVTYTSGDEWYDTLEYVVQEVKDRECFMNRFLIVCADSGCTKKAKEDEYESIEFPEDSSDASSDYGRFTWMKQKITLGIVASGVNLFMFDADVVLFDVPDTKSMLSKPVDVLYQIDYMDYHGAYLNGPDWTKNYLDEVHEHESNFNSGQMWYKASKRVSTWLQMSLAHGVQCAPSCGLEQNVLYEASRMASTTGDESLGVEPFELTLDRLPITYATHCSRTTDMMNDWEVVSHFPEFITLHMCCAGSKYIGMGNALAKRKCSIETPNPNCIDVRASA